MLSLLLLIASHVFAAGFDGIYSGEVALYDRPNEKVPLLISLSLVQNLDQEGNAVRVFSGGFVVDDEGGPYSFQRVRFDVSTGQIDMVYRKVKSIYQSNHPADVRFLGKFQDESTISGRVLSGREGPVGTFTVKKDPQAVFAAKPKYFGIWQGRLKGEYLSMNLAPTGDTFVNPQFADLDFTMGKVGYLAFQSSTSQFAVTRVYIDYLRRYIMISHAPDLGARVVLEGRIEGNTVSGNWNSAFKGLVGEFTLQKSR